MTDRVELGTDDETGARPDPGGEPSAAPAGTADQRPRRRRLRYTLPGAWVALVFGCLSFTPSLLPRTGIMQGLIAGVSAAIGYGLGVAGAWLWRQFPDRPVQPARARSWRAFGVVAVLAVVTAYLAGRYWQNQIRSLMGAPGDRVLSQLAMPFVAAVVFVAIVAAGRGLHRLYRWLARSLNRWIGVRAARAIGWVAVVAGTYLVVSGVLLGQLVELANQTFAIRNQITPAGVTQPASALRSGSPQSLVTWDSLGREGRKFVSGGPSAAAIGAVTGAPAQEPIRVFAGLESAGSSESRAELAVRDLERAGGFDRAHLMVATSTGSGWISPGSADTFEYLTGGDSAIVSMQYSYLPSWISYLVDQRKAREAGRDLFDVVYERWSRLPADARPELVVFGESLGSFGGEAAFSGERDLANRTDGALFTGPPNFNALYREFTDSRLAGSPEREPIFRNGRIVRFDDAEGAAPPPVDAPWPGTRVLYVEHPSDPIVWWSPDLILHRPDWLAERRGGDVLGAMRWIPFVTFWQVSADLPQATAVPAGHGHRYTDEYVASWVRILRPAGWDAQKQAALQAIISGGG